MATLYRRHVDSVVAYAARRCRQPADVADLVAATFLVVVEAAASFDPSRGDALPWILGIARRLHANRSRRRYREQAAYARIDGARLLDSDDVARIAARIDAARLRPAVEQALAALPDRHREVLWLIGHDGLTHEQAAQVLDIAPGALRMRLTRARRALHAALGPAHPDVHAEPLMKER